MPATRAGTLLSRLCHLVETRQSDGQLLQRFVAQRDEAAFAALLDRHGGLVWGICRHILHENHDAEDAFQAAFLVLARRAGSIRRGESLASWLHGVAYRIAVRAKQMTAKRQARERRAAAPVAVPPPDFAARELQALLDEEVARLPEKLRAPFVSCCLEGRSRTEAAAELGWKAGTVSSRVAQARKRLQARLGRRGVTLSAALTAGALWNQPAPGALRQVVREMALLVASGQGIATGVSPSVAALMRGSAPGVAGGKKALLAVVLAAGLVGGLGLAAGLRSEPAPAAVPAQAERPQLKTDLFGDPLPDGALLRLGTVRQRHAMDTSGAAFTPDGKTVIVGDIVGCLLFWDVATGKAVRRIRADHGGIYAVAVSADGKLLAAGGWGNVTLWDAKTGAAMMTWKTGRNAVTRIAFTPDGKTLVLSSGDDTIELWDVAGGTKLHTLKGHAGPVITFAFAPDGKTLASGSVQDANVRLWDVATGEQLRAFPAVDGYRLAGSPGMKSESNVGDVLGVAFSPDGKTLATCGNNSPVRFWDPATGKRLREADPTQHKASLTQLHYLPDGKSLAGLAAFGGMRLCVWDAGTGKLLRESGDVCINPGPGRLVVSPDGKLVATSGGPHTFDLWETATGKRLDRFVGHRERVEALTFAGDGRTLFSASNINPGNPIYEWDLATQKPLREFGKPPSGGAWDMVLSPDHRFLFTCGIDIHQWELATGKEVRVFKGHTSSIRSVSLSADGKTLASGCNYDHTLRLWDVATGKERLKIALEQDDPTPAALSPDGKAVAAGGFRDGSVRVWDTTTGKLVRQIATPHQTVSTVAFSPDGKLLAAAGVGGSVTFFDAATGNLVRQIGEITSGWVGRLAFSRDGRTLAVGGSDRAVSLWETATGGRRATFTGHAGPAHALAFSPDGRRLASGGDDTTILVWDLAGRPLDKPAAELWADLRGEDAAQAYRAVWSLAAAPGPAVRLIGERVKPAAAPPKEVGVKVARLLADLDSDQFAVREKADAGLRRLGKPAEPLLRQALQKELSPEARRRIERVLSRLDQEAAAARVEQGRALEVLEHIDTPEARRLLETLAAGAAGAWLTEEAQAALRRSTARK